MLHGPTRALKSDRPSSLARRMPGTMRSRPPVPRDESVSQRRHPAPAPIEHAAILQINLRLLPLRSAPCRTIVRGHRIAPRKSSRRPGVVAEKARIAPLRTRSPSRPSPCESTQEACAPQRGNRPKHLSVCPLSDRPSRPLPSRPFRPARPLNSCVVDTNAGGIIFRPATRRPANCFRVKSYPAPVWAHLIVKPPALVIIWNAERRLFQQEPPNDYQARRSPAL